MGHGRSAGGAMAAINVTPLADIMIVLLIIFLVITPIIDRGAITLPLATNAEKREERIVVSVDRESTTSLSGQRLDTVGELLPRLQARFEEAPAGGRIVFLKADEGLPYATILQVMRVCREAGAEQVSLVTARRVRG
jgi:biopolymer transport protein TolR